MSFKCFNCFMSVYDPDSNDNCQGDCDKCKTLVKECENCSFRSHIDKDGYVDCLVPDNYPLRKKFIPEHRFKYEFIGPVPPRNDDPYPF